MENNLILKLTGKLIKPSKKTEKNSEGWLNKLKVEEYTDIKINGDVESSKKNNKKNK